MGSAAATPARIVFLGSDEIALPMLRWLRTEGAAQAEIVAVYTQPDRPVGRGQKVQANAIKTWARAENIPVYQPEKLTSEVQAAYADLQPDLGVVMAYGHILRDAFIDTPTCGTINFHTSILPKYRGASPIQTAIASGETETGVTLMRIVRALDAGPIADVARVSIEPMDTAIDVESKLAEACVPLLATCLPDILAGKQTFTEQDHEAATFCRRLSKADGALDFSAPATVLAARINGLFPWPACSTEIAGVPVKVGGALAEAGEGAIGAVVTAEGDALVVGTGEGRLRLTRLQRPGGKLLRAGDFLRGFPVAVGTQLESVPMPALVR